MGRGVEHTKKEMVAVRVLATVLCFGTATIFVLAAEGWARSGSTWVYYDSNGNKIYNTWKKGVDNQQCRFNGEGVMVTNAWVESDYYMDSNGIMLIDKWLKLTGDQSEYEWHYFSSSGKVITDAWKRIDNKQYHFNGDGRTEIGWILDDMYYTGPGGVMQTDWQKPYPPDDDDDSANKVTPGINSVTDDDGRYWHYSFSNGKKYASDSSDGGYTARKIDGTHYCFDENGVMQTGWKNVKSTTNDSIQDYMCSGPDGKAKIGWYSIEPPRDLNGYEEAMEWFYFNNNGRSRATDSERPTIGDIVKLNGKSYLFNHLDSLVYGLKKVYTGSGEDDWTAFYFGDKNKSCVQEGKMKMTKDDDNKSDLYFLDNGRDVSGAKDNYLHYKGELQKAADGQKHVRYRVEGRNYVVNASGKVMKGSNIKNSDGVKFTINSSNELTKADDDSDVDFYAQEPTEPYCTE